MREYNLPLMSTCCVHVSTYFVHVTVYRSWCVYSCYSIHLVVGFVHREKQSVDLDCIQAVYSLIHCITFLALVLIHMHFISSSVLVYLEYWTKPAGEIGDKLVYCDYI